MTASDVIATCSVVVAVLAFFATSWQTWLAFDHNRISVRPMLIWHIDRDTSAEGATITYSLRNLGLGPAIVRDRYFTQGGVRFLPPASASDEVSAFVEAALQSTAKYHLRNFGLPGCGAAIPSQGEFVIGKIFFPGVRAEQLAAIENFVGAANFHVRYESMYRQTFFFSAVNGHQ